jgi:hypothetical protein
MDKSTKDAGVLTVLRGTTYLGSHPRARRRVFDVDIVFTEAGVTLRRNRRREFGAIPWESVVELSAAPWETVEQRPSLIRFWFLGIWAFFFPLKTTYAYLTVRDPVGEWAFAVPNIAARELGAGLEALQPYVREHPSTSGVS